MSKEQLLAAIVDSAIDFAIISMDREGVVVTWNEGARLILGWSEEEMNGKPADIFFTPQDRAKEVPAKEMASALENGRGNDERWHLRKDGTRFWASGEMMTLRDEAGEVRGFIKVLRDRTRQRQEEEKHRADAEFMRRVLYSSDDCIKVLDLDANLTFMSEGGMRVMEVDDFNKIAGCPWPDFWQLEGNAAAKAAVAAARAGESARFVGFANTLKGTGKWWDVQVSPMLGPDGKPDRILSVSRDITATKTAQETQRLLMHELAHRVKNTLAVVQSIAFQSMRNAASLDDAGRKLQARLGALSKAHDVLMQSDWVSASVHDIVQMTAGNVGMEEGDRIVLSGPTVTLAPQAALSFSLVIHELLTNAVKYGALSDPTGHVTVHWQVSRSASGENEFSFTWQENGGPPVIAPERVGFGSKLIRSTLGSLGTVELDYAHSGLRLGFQASLSSIETHQVSRQGNRWAH
nr:PAS domain-containing protein [Rhizobium smilacinae]